MTEDEKKCIVDAIEKIDKRSKADRLFAYIFLIVVTFAVSIVGYNMTELISSLSSNMKSISSDINTMRNQMVSISHNMQSLDNSISTIGSDLHSATGTHEDIAESIKLLSKDINEIQEDINDMNKMNPIRKIF